MKAYSFRMECDIPDPNIYNPKLWRPHLVFGLIYTKDQTALHRTHEAMRDTE